MNTHIKKEIGLAIGLGIIALFCLLSKMTSNMYMWTHGTAILLFIIFAVGIWHTKVQDEREQINRAQSSDIGFTAGGIILAIAMIAQLLKTGSIDIWIMLTLSGMIIVRVVSQLWLNKNH